jgi:hypothetical protein
MTELGAEPSALSGAKCQLRRSHNGPAHNHLGSKAGSAWRAVEPAQPSYFGMLSKRERIFDIDAEVANRALDLRVAQQS